MSDNTLLSAARSAETHAFYGELSKKLEEYQTLAAKHPLTNPIALLGLDIANRLATEETSLAELSAVIQRTSSSAFLSRANRLGDYLGEMSIHRNTNRLEELFDRLAQNSESFEDFNKTLDREWLGVVMTAHPTFGLS